MPIDLILPIRAIKFDLTYVQDITPSGYGFIQTTDRVTPFWVAEYTTPPLTGDRLAIMEHLLLQTEGAKNPFYAYDPSRLCPIEYSLAVASTKWGSAVATAGSYGASTLTCNFGEDIYLRAGDYISYELDGARRLHKCTEGGTGATQTLNVKPRPPNFSGSVPLRLVRAACEMKVIGKPDWNKSVETPPSVTFRAVQFINKGGA